MTEQTPLALTDQQLVTLMDMASQLHTLDREPFLYAVANLFAGRGEVGEGEFNRGVRELLRNSRFKWMQSKSAFSEPAV
jgi:hypothetical protein